MLTITCICFHFCVFSKMCLSDVFFFPRMTKVCWILLHISEFPGEITVCLPERGQRSEPEETVRTPCSCGRQYVTYFLSRILSQGFAAEQNLSHHQPISLFIQTSTLKLLHIVTIGYDTLPLQTACFHYCIVQHVKEMYLNMRPIETEVNKTKKTKRTSLDIVD